MDDRDNLVEILPCKHRICPKCVEKQTFQIPNNEKKIIKCPWENCKSSMDFEDLKVNTNPSTYETIIKINPALFTPKKQHNQLLDLKEEVNPSTHENAIKNTYELFTPKNPTKTLDLKAEENNHEELLLSPKKKPIQTLEFEKEENSKVAQEVLRSLNLTPNEKSVTKNERNKTYFMSSNENNKEDYAGEGLPGLIKNSKISPESTFETYKKADEKNRVSSSINLISDGDENKFLDHYVKADILNKIINQRKPNTSKIGDNACYCCCKK